MLVFLDHGAERTRNTEAVSLKDGVLVFFLPSLKTHPPLIRSHPGGGSRFALLWGHVWGSSSDRSDDELAHLQSQNTHLCYLLYTENVVMFGTISHLWIRYPCTSLLPLPRLGHRSHTLAGSPTSLPSSCWRPCRPLTQQNGTPAVRLARGCPEFWVEARWGQTWLRLLWNQKSRFRTAARVGSVF